MSVASMILIAAIAALHLYISWFEIFAWESRGPKVFRSFPKHLFAPTKAIAANQGVYNSFLAAGLIWSLFIGDMEWARRVATCFLLGVSVVGLFGAFTVSRRIAIVQTGPAVLAMLLVWFS